MSVSKRAWSCHVVFFLLALGLAALAGRLLVFQSRCQADMVRKAEAQQRIVQEIPGRRGDIWARSYSMPVLLAGSRQAPGVFADPRLLDPEDIRPVAQSAGTALNLPAERVEATIRQARQANRAFVWLARDVDAATVQRVRALELRAVNIRTEWRREYPNGSLAAHAVGFASPDGQGLEGIELYADTHLRAVDGRSILWGDAARRAIWNDPDPNAFQPPVDGRHVQLTIDVAIQRHLEQQLAQTVAKCSAESAIGVVVDPRNGEILALASEPTFDLNAYGQASPDQRRNRAITDPYEPGSVFKPFVASGALALGKIRYGQEIFCNNGAYQCRPGRTLHDVGNGNGNLTFEAIVFKSSNIGMAHIGERLGNTALYRVITAYGFGAPAGIELRGEDAGLVNPLKKWTVDTKWSVPMGQEVGVTGLQMAMAFSALANDGLLLRPKLVRAVYGPEGVVELDRAGSVPVRQVVEPEVARQFVQRVLALVPTEGTGKAGRLTGWSSFGKTGTAQISPYGSGQYTASYIAGAPLQKPRLVCLISIRKPDPRRGGYYGGQLAAPVVKAVLEHALAYLDVPRDQEPAAKDKPAVARRGG